MTGSENAKTCLRFSWFYKFNIKGTEGSAIKSVFSINQLLQRFIYYFKFT